MVKAKSSIGIEKTYACSIGWTILRLRERTTEVDMILKKLFEDGLWLGPRLRLFDRLQFAYEGLGGWFGVFTDLSEIGCAYNELFLGSPSSYFQPVVGRDYVLGVNRSLQLLDVEKFSSIEGLLVHVEESDVFKIVDLDWSLQSEIIEPSSIPAVSIVGLNALGCEIAVCLGKMGCREIGLVDNLPLDFHSSNGSLNLLGSRQSEVVLKKEIAVSSYRVFDADRIRTDVVKELLSDGSLSKSSSCGGEVVIACVRSRKLWEEVRNASLLIFSCFQQEDPARSRIDVSIGEVGKIYCLDPRGRS